MITEEEDLDPQEEAAYDAWEEARLEDAARLLDELLRERPDETHLHYMRGLVHKYRREWDGCLQHNRLALVRLSAGDEGYEPSVWNAAIAATALCDWREARRLWAMLGKDVGSGDEPIEGDFGTAVMRLNAWGDGETVWFRRLSPCHGRLLNVPMPESGFRFGDIVVHDGAQMGTRVSDGRQFPVLNALQRIGESSFATFTVLVDAAGPADIEALEEIRVPGLGYLEDWTGSFVALCRRCSYGVEHTHAAAADDDASNDDEWQSERDVGIAAQSRAVVDAVLDAWLAGGRATRRVDGVQREDHPLISPAPGVDYWSGLGEDDDESSD